jgi:hypothetical protein
VTRRRAADAASGVKDSVFVSNSVHVSAVLGAVEQRHRRVCRGVVAHVTLCEVVVT